MESLAELKDQWKNTKEFHKGIHELFNEKTNAVPELKAHRDWVEQKIWGFGERSFLWMWWLLVKEMPQEFTFCEIGVFRGQILSLIKLIADMQGKKVTRIAITPMSTASDAGEAKNWESDYKRDIEVIHEHFKLEKDYITLHGLSTDKKIIKQAQKYKFDLLFVDGAHDYHSVLSDLNNYTPLINTGGYLICDDACNDLAIWFGGFPGLQSCTDAVIAWFAGVTPPQFTFVGNVVHDRIYKKY